MMDSNYQIISQRDFNSNPYSTWENSAGRIFSSWSVTRLRISIAISSNGMISSRAILSGLRCGYPTHTAIKLILHNHSAHISKETKVWLADQPVGRFEFTFTPKHGSWLNLVEGFFSKLARSVLRHIRVESKQELKDRIMAAMDEFNRYPVVHTWSYKLDQAA